MSIKKKVLSKDLDEWNYPLRVQLLLPAFAVVGFTVGYLGVPHFLDSRVLVGVGTAFLGGLVVFLGGVLLALID